MEYLLMLVSICFAVTNNCLLHRLPPSTFRTPGDIYFYNGCINGGWVVLMVIFSAITNDFAISGESVIFGIIYGVLLVVFLLSKSMAMVEGPVDPNVPASILQMHRHATIILDAEAAALLNQ